MFEKFGMAIILALVLLIYVIEAVDSIKRKKWHSVGSLIVQIFIILIALACAISFV